MTGLTAVSLFAGIEGFGLALERAGVQVVAAVEIDPDCRGVIARHFPKTTLFNDVTEVTGDQLRAAGFVPRAGNPHRRIPLPGPLGGRPPRGPGWRTLRAVLAGRAAGRRTAPTVAPS